MLKARRVLISASLPKAPFPVKGCVCLVGSASCRTSGHTRPASVPGLYYRGYRPRPSKDACSQPHKATMQGRIMTAAKSRYARMHKDSHTKPLHDATAQMAVNAQMQRHKWLSMHKCNGTNGCQCTDAVAQMADDLYGGYAPKQGCFGCLPKVISKDAYVS